MDNTYYKRAQPNSTTINDANSSAQTIKPSTVFSPGDAIQRKNDTLVLQKQQVQWDK